MLIDFGLAYNFEINDEVLVRCGTPGYTAPEILRNCSKEG
jgi:serine/threonine protein kinase